MSDSIKVAIKVRPLIKREKDENLPIQWTVQGNYIVSTDSEIKKRGDGGFHFDHIFDERTSNKDVFDIVVRPIVDATVNGFNGTVFAYGQTSSGKTYTMMGVLNEPGIIPLAVEHMFDAIANTVRREFLLRVSYLEIYNERVNDLLNKGGTDLKLHEDVNGQIIIKCKEEVTNSPEHVLSIMKKGDKNRRIGETNMNERSSRSHTIFRITIESRESDADSDGAVQVSQLNLVDLAGSERARQTGATGERFKEGRHINMSLSALGLVIMQLSESQDIQKYVNFRDSKLTRLLQASLGGNAMTAIICAITPAALEESQCTLSFASRAKSVKNKPQINEVMSDATLLKRYAKQIAKLNAELEKMKQENRTAEEMENKLHEKDRANQLLEERIELLKTRIVSGDNTNIEEPFRCRSRRRQTWGGPATFKQNLSFFQPSMDLPTIKEMSPEKPCRKSIIQSVDLMNETFQTAFADFELELIKDERDRENEDDSDEELFITKRKSQNHVTFMDDVCIYKPNYDIYETTPEKNSISDQTISNSQESPGTPKNVLRERLDYLKQEFDELREYTTLEKQLYIENHQCVTITEEQKKIAELEEQIRRFIAEKTERTEQIINLKKQIVELTSAKTKAEHLLIEFDESNEKKQKEIEEYNKIDNFAVSTCDKSVITDNYQEKLEEKKKEIQQIAKSKDLQSVLEEGKQLIEFSPIKPRRSLQQLKTSNTSETGDLAKYRRHSETSYVSKNSSKIGEDNTLFVDVQGEFEEIGNVVAGISKCKNNSTVKSTDIKEMSHSSLDNFNFENILSQLHVYLNKIEKYEILKLDELTEMFASQKHESQYILSELNRTNIETDYSHIRNFINESSNLKGPLQDLEVFIRSIVAENSDMREHLQKQSIVSTEGYNSNIDNEELVTDLDMKTQELHEIKNDVIGLKLDMKKLQRTIFLLTTENVELSAKLTTEKEEARKTKANYQKTIDDLCEEISKIKDEKMDLLNENLMLNEEVKCLKSQIINVKESQFCLNCQDKINKSTVKNIESFHTNVEEHVDLQNVEQTNSLTDIHELRTDKEHGDNPNNLLLDCSALETEVKTSSENNSERNEKNIDQLILENNLLKAELLKLEEKISGENTKFLKESTEILKDNVQNNACDSPLDITSVFTTTFDEANEKMEDQKPDILLHNYAALKEKFDHLLQLNKKLRDSKTTTCAQCAQMKELNESNKVGKSEVKVLTHKLEDMEEKFKRKCADIEVLRNKANEELSLSICETSLDTSLLDGTNVTFVENEVSHLNKEMQVLKDERTKLSYLYEEKCNELEKLHNNTLNETDTVSPLKKDTKKSKFRIEKLEKDIDHVKVDLQELKNNVICDLKKSLNEKASLLNEINMLKSVNDELSKVVSHNNLLLETSDKNIKSLENEIIHLHTEIENYKMIQEQMQNEKYNLETEMASIKMNVEEKEVIIKDLQQIINKCKQENEGLKEDTFCTENFIKENFNTVEYLNKNKHNLENESGNEIQKLKDDLNAARNCITKEIRSLKPEKDDEELFNKSVDDLFLTFLEILMSKEKEIIDLMQEQFSSDRQRLEDEKQESIDEKNRVTLWAKELETENTKLQNDIVKQVAERNELLNKITCVEDLLKESIHEKQILAEKIQSLEEDYENLQTNFDKQSEMKEQEIIAVKNKEMELRAEMKQEREEYELKNNEQLELLKKQLEEQKLATNKYKTELNSLKVDSELQLNNIKDAFNTESAKYAEVNKQLSELSNKNVHLLTELDTLKEQCRQLEEKNMKLEQKMRNSVSKMKAETQIEDLQEQNKSLQNNLEGAYNCIAELKDKKNHLSEELINIKKQHESLFEENMKMKDLLSDNAKQNNSNLHTLQEQYNALLNEKSKIVLELEESKTLLCQKEQDLKYHINQFEDLKQKNKELDEEVEGLIRENETLTEKIYSFFDDNASENIVQTEINILKEENTKLRVELTRFDNITKSHTKLQTKTADVTENFDGRNEIFQQEKQLKSNISNINKETNDDTNINIKKQIQDLELELVSKNARIATLELQIQSEHNPYKKKCKVLEENIYIFRSKNTQLESEVKKLKHALSDLNMKECYMCKNRYINTKDQYVQTVSNNRIQFCGTSSGIVDEYMQVQKLEKEKALMKELCRSRAKQIKELEDKIIELENTKTLSNVSSVALKENIFRSTSRSFSN